jgi:hypothetical protein
MDVSSDDGDIENYVRSQLEEPITSLRLSLHQYGCVVSCPVFCESIYILHAIELCFRVCCMA